MTTATDSPLLALLGKGAAGPTQPGVADVEDKRALDAALEFAALLLDAEAGADTPGGNALPGEDGKTLPVAVPVALPLKEGNVPTGDAAAPASATPLIEGARKEVLDPIINRPLG
ncbi:MAG: hypothetical protein AAGJ36_06760, partial [Pseudomonadota bacterium]